LIKRLFEYLQLVDSLEDYHLSKDQQLPIKLLCGSDEPIGWASKRKGKPIRGLDSDSMRTVGCVLYLAKYHVSLLDSLLSSCRIGGDVDSIAAVLMGLMCARYGLVFSPAKSGSAVIQNNASPDFFVYELEGIEYILTVAEAFRLVFD